MKPGTYTLSLPPTVDIKFIFEIRELLQKQTIKPLACYTLHAKTDSTQLNDTIYIKRHV